MTGNQGRSHGSDFWSAAWFHWQTLAKPYEILVEEVASIYPPTGDAPARTFPSTEAAKKVRTITIIQEQKIQIPKNRNPTRHQVPQNTSKSSNKTQSI